MRWVLCLLVVVVMGADAKSEKLPEINLIVRQMIIDINKILATRPPKEATTVEQDKFESSRREKIREILESLNKKPVSIIGVVQDVFPAEKFGGKYANAPLFATLEVSVPGNGPKSPAKKISVAIAGNEEDFKDWKKGQIKTVEARVFHFIAVNLWSSTNDGIVYAAKIDEITTLLWMPSLADN